MRVLPNILRVFQNLRVMSLKALIGALRFTLKGCLQLFYQFSWQWIILKTFLSIWDTYNDYTKQFRMERVRKNGACFYPKWAIIALYSVNVVMIWLWPVAGIYQSTFKIIRRVCWNYCRLESRAAEAPEKHVLINIIEYYTHKEIDDICL